MNVTHLGRLSSDVLAAPEVSTIRMPKRPSSGQLSIEDYLNAMAPQTSNG